MAKKFFQQHLQSSIKRHPLEGSADNASFELVFSKSGSAEHPLIHNFGVAHQFFRLLAPHLLGKANAENNAAFAWHGNSRLGVVLTPSYADFIGGDAGVGAVMRNFKARLDELEGFMGLSLSAFKHDQWLSSSAYAHLAETVCAFKIATISIKNNLQIIIAGDEFYMKTTLGDTIKSLATQRNSVARLSSLSFDDGVGTISLDIDKTDPARKPVKFRLEKIELIDRLIAYKERANITYRPTIDLLSRDRGQICSILIEDVEASNSVIDQSEALFA